MALTASGPHFEAIAMAAKPPHDAPPPSPARDLPATAAAAAGLLALLPGPLLLDVLQRLDVPSRCSASRTCRSLSQAAASPLLWPAAAGACHDVLLWDVRCVLARQLRLPPQVFSAQLDVRRSRRFPVTVPLLNLRPLLAVTDTEALAERLGKAVQAQVERVARSLWRHDDWRSYPPAASISICRADRSCVRASLRPEAVVPQLVCRLQQLGWPPGTGAVEECQTPAAENALQALQVCRQRLALLHEGRLAPLLPCRPASPSSCEQRTAMQHTPAAAPPLAARGGNAGGRGGAASERSLPDELTARLAAQAQLEAQGVEAASASRLACYASRLLHVAAAADPSALAFSTPARPGWLLLAQQASKVIARLHTLRQLCACRGGAGGAAQPQQQQQQQQQQQLQAAAWAAAGPAELQLCLGLRELFVVLASPCCSAAGLVKCVLAIEVAAAEYATAPAPASGSGVEAVAARMTAVLTLQAADRPPLRRAMHTETLRALSWCLWLLGVLE